MSMFFVIRFQYMLNCLNSVNDNCNGITLFCRPDSVIKDAMASAIVNDFPCLKDPKGTGYVSMKIIKQKSTI